MRKIAISLSKGGVGKTTTAINLAAGLSATGGQVLLVDTDTQGHVARCLGIQAPVGLAELVMGKRSLDEVVIEARPNLYLLAGGESLAGVKHEIARRDVGASFVLSEALEVASGRFDYLILDTSPGWDALAVNVLVYADEALTPVSLSSMSIYGLIDFTNNLKRIGRYHRTATHRYVLPTFLDRRAKEPAEILRQLEKYYSDQLLTPIRYNIRLSEAPGHKKTIFEYDPESKGAEDYRALVERIHHDTRKNT